MQTQGGIVIEVRPYIASDYAAIKQIYRSSIQQLGPEYYSPAQVLAWAGYANDDRIFSEWLGESKILVAIDQTSAILGFGGLQRPCRISCLFVAPDSARKGIGSVLVEHLLSLEPSQSSYTTEASELSKRLFEKFGFRVAEIEHTEVSDVRFTRYAMQKHT